MKLPDNDMAGENERIKKVKELVSEVLLLTEDLLEGILENARLKKEIQELRLQVSRLENPLN